MAASAVPIPFIDMSLISIRYGMNLDSISPTARFLGFHGG
jgi:hypothetical protein